MRLPLLLPLLLTLTACSGNSTPPGALAGSPASATPTATASGAPASPDPNASAPTRPLPTEPVPDPTAASATAIRLTGDGVDLPAQVVVFGTTYREARDTLDRGLGTPSADTGPVDPFSAYGTCPGSDLRVLEYDGGALHLMFGTLTGDTEMTFYGWSLVDQAPQVPTASALVGDVTTYDFGVGTTVAQLQEGLGQMLEIAEGDEMLPPSFRVGDQSGGFFGFLTTTGPTGAVVSVVGGEGCGE